MNSNSIRSIACITAAFPTLAAAHGGEIHESTSSFMGQNTAHLHLLTNHLPIFGIVMGLLALVLAFMWKSDVSKRIALILLLVTTVGAYPTFKFGQYAYKDVRGIADDAGQDWLDTHMERAESGIYAFYIAAFIIAAAIFAGWRKLRWETPLTLAAGIASVAALVTAGWIADAGGRIRHPEVRDSAPPPSATSAHQHE